MAQNAYAEPDGEQVPRLDADEFEEGTLYWLVAVEDADLSGRPLDREGENSAR